MRPLGFGIFEATCFEAPALLATPLMIGGTGQLWSRGILPGRGLAFQWRGLVSCGAMTADAHTQDDTAIAALVSSDDTFRPVMAALKDIADESLKILMPIEPHVNGLRPAGKYNSLMHARLCRLKMLGLSDANAARALGLSQPTISVWRQRYPKLADDMHTAISLGTAHAAAILQGLMQGGGPTAFNAVRFYLTTHAPEFAEKQHVEITGDVQHTIRTIRSALFGLSDASGEEEGGAAASGPILDAEVEPLALPDLPRAVFADEPSEKGEKLLVMDL